jgi:2-phosphosulfolactate phosphatase
MAASWAGQAGADVRFDWGPAGVEAVGGAVLVVVDVLRFTTAVDAAVSRGVAVHPYRWRDASAAGFAAGVGAMLADGAAGRPSLSPASLLPLEAGTAVVLPSPNGSTCAALGAEAGATVVAACLRNAGAVAAWLDEQGTAPVTVIACGERWPDGSLRPALEDVLGAGAVIAGLRGDRSPEAAAAAAVWRDAEARLPEILAACASGREQVARGWTDDLAYASAVGASTTVPVLDAGAFRDAARVGGDG